MKFLKSVVTSKEELVDTVYLIVLQGFNQLLPLFVMPYLMKVLGAGGYGEIGYALAVIQYIDLIVTFGFNLSATKLIAQSGDDKNQYSTYFWNVVCAKLLLLLASCLLLFFATEFVPSIHKYKYVIYATLPMAVGSAFTFMWFFQGMGMVRLFSILNTCSKILLLPLVFFFVKDESDVIWAAFLQASVFVLTAVISNIYILKKKILVWKAPSIKGVLHVVKDSFPLFLSTASTSVYTQFFVVVLGFYCTSEMIGRYTSAERIMRALVFLVYVPISQAFYPRISKQVCQNYSLARENFRNALYVTGICMFCIGVFIFFGGDYIAEWLGGAYKGLDDILRIMAFVPLAIGVGGILGQMGLIAMGTNTDKLHFRNVYFYVALISLVTVLPLVANFYETGAAIALLVSEWLVLIFMLFYNVKKK